MMWEGIAPNVLANANHPARNTSVLGRAQALATHSYDSHNTGNRCHARDDFTCDYGNRVSHPRVEYWHVPFATGAAQ